MRNGRIFAALSCISLLLAVGSVYLLYRSYHVQTSLVVGKGYCAGFDALNGWITFQYSYGLSTSPPRDVTGLNEPVCMWFGSEHNPGNSRTSWGEVVTPPPFSPSIVGIFHGFSTPILVWPPLLSILPTAWLIRSLRRQRRQTPVCRQCGYDLRGHQGFAHIVCPECGSPYSPQPRRAFHSSFTAARTCCLTVLVWGCAAAIVLVGYLVCASGTCVNELYAGRSGSVSLAAWHSSLVLAYDGQRPLGTDEGLPGRNLFDWITLDYWPDAGLTWHDPSFPPELYYFPWSIFESQSARWGRIDPQRGDGWYLRLPAWAVIGTAAVFPAWVLARRTWIRWYRRKPGR